MPCPHPLLVTCSAWSSQPRCTAHRVHQQRTLPPRCPGIGEALLGCARSASMPVDEFSCCCCCFDFWGMGGEGERERDRHHTRHPDWWPVDVFGCSACFYWNGYRGQDGARHTGRGTGRSAHRKARGAGHVDREPRARDQTCLGGHAVARLAARAGQYCRPVARAGRLRRAGRCQRQREHRAGDPHHNGKVGNGKAVGGGGTRRPTARSVWRQPRALVVAADVMN